MDGTQPGQIITPHNSGDPQQPQPGGGAPEPPEPPFTAPAPDPDPVPGPGPAFEPSVVNSVVPQAVDQLEPELSSAAGWQFRQEADDDYPADSRQPLPNDISWTASEFIAHEKSTRWYIAVIASAVVAAALDYLLTKDKITPVVIVFVAIVFAAFAARKPQTQDYAVDRRGVHIGQKSYSFQDFKNFSVVEEGAIASVVFMPLKRFMPPLTIYVAPDMEDQILDFLSAILPFEQHRADAIDSLMRRIRF